MKVLIRVGMAVLALAMVAALALTSPAPVLAEPIVCSDIVAFCQDDTDGNNFFFAICVNYYLDDLDCSNTVLCEDSAYGDFCDGDADSSEDFFLCMDYFGNLCGSSGEDACGPSPDCSICETLEGCLSACDAAASCNPDVACEEDFICEAFCESGGFATAGTCEVDNCADDGRVNTNCSAPEIVYCNGDDANFYAYNYETLEGNFDFSLSLADLQQAVDEKTLVKQDGTVKVYLMPDGRVLLVAQQPDGKDYFMYWNPNTCTSLQESAEWGVD